MAHATESKAFVQARMNSLNATLNSKEAWKMDIKYAREFQHAVDRAAADLNEGVIKHAKAKRMQQLEAHAADVCYTKTDFDFMQAQQCEKFHYDNDYKLNLASRFFRDHMVRHLKEYDACMTGSSFESLPTNADKDRAFLDCHHRWVRNLKQEVTPDLE